MNPHDKKFFRKLYLALGFLVALTLFGVIGFMIIMDYGIVQAFYMTVIVISTVGLSAVKEEITPDGMLFIAILIIVSLGLFTYGVTVVTSYITEGDLRNYLKYRKVKKRIIHLKDHVIICGYGRNGQQASSQLSYHQVPHVIVEKDPGLIEELELDENCLYVEGDATHDEVLKEAGIQLAGSLITALPDDSDNVYVVLTAKGLNPNLKIISRASQDRAFLKLKRAGADNVIMPDKIGGTHMASLVIKPDVIEFIDVVLGRSDYNLEEVCFGDTGSRFIGKTLNDTGLIQLEGVNVIGMKMGDGSYQLNPGPEIDITEGTKVFILCKADKIGEALRQLNG